MSERATDVMPVDLERLRILPSRMRAWDKSLHKLFQVGEWGVATCGRGLAAVRRGGIAGPYAGSAPGVVPEIQRLTQVVLGDTCLPVSWLRGYVTPVPSCPPCDVCGCSGEIECSPCDGEGFIDCDDAEDVCLGCGGTGFVKCVCGWPPYRPCDSFLEIEGALFDSALLGEWMSVITAETFRFLAPKDSSGPIHIGDDDWRVIVMPIRRKLCSQHDLKKVKAAISLRAEPLAAGV